MNQPPDDELPEAELPDDGLLNTQNGLPPSSCSVSNSSEYTDAMDFEDEPSSNRSDVPIHGTSHLDKLCWAKLDDQIQTFRDMFKD